MNIGFFGNSHSGKSSIIKVIFQKLPVTDTGLLPHTPHIQQTPIKNNPYIQYTVFQFPAKLDLHNLTSFQQQSLQKLHMLIYVLDSQQYPYNKSVDGILLIFEKIISINPTCLLQVFIHKADGDLYVNEDDKLDLQNQVSDQVRTEAQSKGIPDPSFHMTTIYDLSLHEALSKVLLKIHPQMDHLQNILDVLVQYCKLDKVYVFDVITKLFVVTDSTPVDLMTYELCSDMIDVVIDVSCIYGLQESEGYKAAFDMKSTSVIKVQTNTSGMTLYLREVDELLALVCIVKDDDFDRQELLDYNINCFRKGVKKVFQVREKQSNILEETKMVQSNYFQENEIGVKRRMIDFIEV